MVSYLFVHHYPMKTKSSHMCTRGRGKRALQNKTPKHTPSHGFIKTRAHTRIYILWLKHVCIYVIKIIFVYNLIVNWSGWKFWNCLGIPTLKWSFKGWSCVYKYAHKITYMCVFIYIHILNLNVYIENSSDLIRIMSNFFFSLNNKNVFSHSYEA